MHIPGQAYIQISNHVLWLQPSALIPPACIDYTRTITRELEKSGVIVTPG